MLHENREGALDIECAANIEYDEFLPKSLRGSLHLSSVGLGIRFSQLTITAILVA